MMAIALTGCGFRASEPNPVFTESILTVPIPNTSNDRQLTEGDRQVTRLLDVDGDWEAVSVAMVDIVEAEGWSVFRLNCVGSGNDIIAKKWVREQWLLVEAGAGGRGAGVIVSIPDDQSPPGSLVVMGNCPAELVEAVG